ncbi:MAG: peptidylprolyl isomerase [Caldimicrobium sp.]|nr:peptidylprolyl isomerase [Caldimicrobium sp.]MCX7872956.1 peptidylprolyl isomerase [Caldimicrobium sp.]MDW8094574.1 peptidylprolyl isomerase [Caldimicrobium sp.]
MQKLVALLMQSLVILFMVSRSLADRVIAEVGPYKLFESELQEQIKSDPQLVEILKANPNFKEQVEKSLIERWINISLLALGAKAEGLEALPQVKKKLEEAEKMVLAEIFLQKKLQNLEVTEREMREFYEKNKSQYKEPEAVKVKHILVYVPQNADNKTKERALTRAKQIRNQLVKGAKFEELARIHSDDTASKEKGGDLGILRRGETMPEFEQEIFKLKPGEISQPIASPYGFHIVKVEKKISESILPFDAAKERVREDLKREKEREIVSMLLERIKQKNPPKVYLKERVNKDGGR